jgi:hypothetical protein
MRLGPRGGIENLSELHIMRLCGLAPRSSYHDVQSEILGLTSMTAWPSYHRPEFQDWMHALGVVQHNFSRLEAATIHFELLNAQTLGLPPIDPLDRKRYLINRVQDLKSSITEIVSGFRGAVEYGLSGVEAIIKQRNRIIHDVYTVYKISGNESPKFDPQLIQRDSSGFVVRQVDLTALRRFADSIPPYETYFYELSRTYGWVQAQIAQQSSSSAAPLLPDKPLLPADLPIVSN